MAQRDYPSVMKMSADPSALLAAWAKPIGRDEAVRVIYTYVDESELPQLEFINRTGRGRAWGDIGRVTLPKDESKLTLGLVLHELAHIIEWSDKNTRGHGRNFVTVLDGLVFSENEWAKTHTQKPNI